MRAHLGHRTHLTKQVSSFCCFVIPLRRVRSISTGEKIVNHIVFKSGFHYLKLLQQIRGILISFRYNTTGMPKSFKNAPSARLTRSFRTQVQSVQHFPSLADTWNKSLKRFDFLLNGVRNFELDLG